MRRVKEKSLVGKLTLLAQRKELFGWNANVFIFLFLDYTTKMYFLTVWEARSPRSTCQGFF